jgi:4-hydroxy-3-methylbut-2-enyl diphosphate reductase
VDAVCPLVTKVHHELKVRARKGYTVLYVGHHGHEEAVGTMAVAPESVRLLERVEDVDALDLAPTNRTHVVGDIAGDHGDQPMVALLAQTTLSHDEWAGIVDRARQRFPELWMPNRSDLCFATTNRQAALQALAGRCNSVVVIGSENSSNTVALTKVAEAFGCPRVVRVNDASELPDDLSGTVGVTAGASAPEALVDAVVERLAPIHGIEIAAVTIEEEYFPPPPELRDLLRGLEAAIGLLNSVPDSGPDGDRVLGDDRSAVAADVLEQIARPPV